MRYCFAQGDWEAAKKEMVVLLAARAKVRGLIPYRDLVRHVKSIRLEPNSLALAAMLGEVSEAEDAAGRGLLTVVVVHKHGDMTARPRVLRPRHASGPRHTRHRQVLGRGAEEGTRLLEQVAVLAEVTFGVTRPSRAARSTTSAAVGAAAMVFSAVGSGRGAGDAACLARSTRAQRRRGRMGSKARPLVTGRS